MKKKVIMEGNSGKCKIKIRLEINKKLKKMFRKGDS